MTAPMVPPDEWRAAARRRLDDGERFCGAYASGGRWNAMFASGPDTTVVATEPVARTVPTLVDLIPAAAWDEREAADLHGLAFDGHRPLRPLVDHAAPTDSWTVAVSGPGVNQVAVGPIHAGVIESGHFRFHVVGERVLAVDLRLFYKHRGLEQAAEGHDGAAALPYAQRACGACAVTNSVAYAQAWESLSGLRAGRDLARARTLFLELERLYNHLNDIAAICAGVGFAPGKSAFAELKERAMRLNLRLGGHRFLFGAIAVGGSRVAIDEPAARSARAELQELSADAARVWRELSFNGSVQARLGGVGTLARDAAVALGTVGPAARASGVRRDTRTDSPQLWYGTTFAAAAPPETTGDVAARLEMRPVELQQTFEILDEILSGAVPAAAAEPAGEAAPGSGIARVESPRGETVCVIESSGSKVSRLHLRTGSYANWPAVAHATADNLLPDFPLINKSFELCYACADR